MACSYLELAAGLCIVCTQRSRAPSLCLVPKCFRLTVQASELRESKGGKFQGERERERSVRLWLFERSKEKERSRIKLWLLKREKLVEEWRAVVVAVRVGWWWWPMRESQVGESE